MASRPIFSPYQVVTNGDASGSIVSIVTIVQNLSMVSYDVSFTGTPTGTLSVQVSNTYTQNAAGQVLNPGRWTNLPLSGTTVVLGSVPIAAAGNGFIDVDQIGSYAMRLVYTAISGSGTMNATINGKVA